MKIIYTPGALRQLDEALDYIEARSPQGAQQVKASIRKTIDMLSQHPLVGRVTNVPGQRRIVVSRCPYAIFLPLHAERRCHSSGAPYGTQTDSDVLIKQPDRPGQVRRAGETLC